MKKFSIILTTYNSEKYLKRILISIRNQIGIGKLFDMELIIVDDCSTDKTWDILASRNAGLGNINFEIHIIRTPYNSGGPNKGRNIGLEIASGDYITIVDHDDEWRKDRILSVLRYLSKAPIITSGYKVINETFVEKKVCHRVKDYLFFQQNETFLKRLKKSHSGQNTYLGSIIYDKRFKNIRFEEKFGMVDFDWLLRLFHQNCSLEISEALYTRYVTKGNLSFDETYRQKDFEYSLAFIERYKRMYPRETRIARRRIHGTRARYHYLMKEMRDARKHFLRAGIHWKNFVYFFSTFYGYDFVNKRFKVFG